MPDDQQTTWRMSEPSPEALGVAFSAGACAAYDDCGHESPPFWYATEQERDAWRRGLAAGYEDCESLARILLREATNAH